MQGGDSKLSEAKNRLLRSIEIQESGCWFVGSEESKAKLGYSRIMVDYEIDSAHRWSYRVFKGPIPPGLLVRHTCDMPPCVRPGDLILGTQSQNIMDAVERGRYVKNHGGAKLSLDQVNYVRSSSETQVDLGKKFGVCRNTIAEIKHGRSWVA